MSAQPEYTPWWSDPIIAAALALPDCRYLQELEARTRALMVAALGGRAMPVDPMPELRDLRPLSDEAARRRGFPCWTDEDEEPTSPAAAEEGVRVDMAGVEAWLMSPGAQDYLPESED